MVLVLIVAGCNTLFGSDDNDAVVPPTPVASSPAPSSPVKLVDDLDEDGIEDKVDNDADGDGVKRSSDIDDHDPDKGKRKPKPKPEPEPEAEQPISGVHPGAFCGDPGVVGIGTNGRTYTCSGGHWRR
ncbi:hypothetical protein AB0J28_47045 [Streptosporangium canum]|uniref:hypothetical protein n=1 Tax=Streptosporangium canum TaxID=324952 RepID=UPI003429FFCE